MPYARKYKRKFRKTKRNFRRNKRKGFRKRDYTPAVKLEAYFTVGTTANASSALTFATNTTAFTIAVPYTACFDTSGTWGKYSTNYAAYKITGIGLEWIFTKDTGTIDGLFNQMPYIVGVNFPSEVVNTFQPTASTLKQMDNAFNICPKTNGPSRYYQRFPSNYLNNKIDAVGVGTWNSVENSAKQMGQFAFQPVNASAANNTAPAAFALLKMSLYVRFASKRI